MPNTPNLRAVIERFGLAVDKIDLTPDGAASILKVCGRYPDGIPFTAITRPFVGDPVRRAATLAGQVFSGHPFSRPDSNAIGAGADRLALARQVAVAWVEGRNSHMALSDKLANIAARAHEIPKALEARADALMPRLDAVERQGHAAFDGLESHITDAEAAVAATEAAVRQISNIPFGSSGSSSTG